MNSHIKSALLTLRLLLRLLSQASRNGSRCAATLLDTRIFPSIIAFATHRVHLAFLLLLWLSLVLLFPIAVWELLGGNYFNGLCGLISCILLAKQNEHHRESQRRHDRHEAEMAKLHDKVDQLSGAQIAQRERRHPHVRHIYDRSEDIENIQSSKDDTEDKDA